MIAAMAARHSARSKASRHVALSMLLCALALLTGGCDIVTPGAVPRIVDAEDARPRLLATTSGPVVGVASAQGQAFLGIPYAAPPVGPLRWRAPRPPAAWTEPRSARELGESCLQNLSLDAQTGGVGSGPFLGGEDCLTLNVYAPADAATGQRRPVMVWIHGGAFVLGASGQYDPSLLASRTGSVVVTFNYRLGALGFLAHPALRTEPGEGAFALLDQQAALRWVRDNIGGVGGDPRNVTLFGQSAGAWSTCYQMASPGAAGLFYRAILQSGACTAPEMSIDARRAEQGGQTWAEGLGCGGTDALACLRAKPATDVLSAAPERSGVTGPNSWSPAYGLDVLPSSPRQAFETGRFNRVPVIDGTNRDEGRLFSYLRGFRGELWSRDSYERIIAAQFGEEAPRILGEYAKDSASPALAYGDVLTDGLFACAARSLDRSLVRWTPVYAYEFDDVEAPFGLPAVPWSSRMGAFHTAEIAYVFGTRWLLADPAVFDVGQRTLSTAIQGYWARFARSGDPNDAFMEPRAWSRFGTTQSVLALGSGGGGAIDFAGRHHCAFWSSLGY